MRTRMRFGGDLPEVRPAWRDERGFTLIEVMIAILLMMVGLLAAADSFPHLTAMSLYGKDQTRSTNLAQQQVEVYRNTATSTLAGLVGDYGTVASQSFDQNGNTVTQTSATYFTRDVQIQYWTWAALTGAFAAPASPYVAPAVGTNYVFHIAVATHWPVRGQTAYTSGNSNSPNGCVTGGSAVTVGIGCVTVGTFVTP
jgi:prepilin-type N-terminal cleavage/methylation domain-containing protein